MRKPRGGLNCHSALEVTSYLADRALHGRGIPMSSSPTGSPRRIDPATVALANRQLTIALIALQLGCPRCRPSATVTKRWVSPS